MTKAQNAVPPGREGGTSWEGPETYYNLFLTMAQGVVYQAANGAIIRANPAAERILGLPFEAMMGRTSLDPRWHTLKENGEILGGADHPAMLALKSGKPVLHRLLGVYHPEEDRHRWLLVDAIPEFSDGENRPFQVLTIFTDITERRMAETALQQSEERFRLTFQASPDAININRLSDGMFVDMNEGFTVLTGYSREEVLGRTSFEIDIWRDPDDRRKLVEGLRRDGFYNDFRATFRRKNGEFGHGRMSARIIRLAGMPHIISVTRDITEQTGTLEALRASENLLASILRTAPTAIGVVSNRVFVAVNDRMCAMVGYTKEELIGKSSRMLYVSDEDYTFVGTEKYRQITAQGTGTVETRWQRKDHEVIDILMSSSPIDPKDLSAGVTFTALDISERKRAEAEREKLQGQLLQSHKMESVGRLAGGVAHDFNNMLGVILGHTEMLLLKTKPELPLYGDLQEIQKAAGRSADLTRQLLAFARKQTITPQVLDLNKTVEGMLNLLRRLIGEDIDLAWLPGRKLWPVHIDPSQLDQILANLCANARDAIVGCGKVTIETQCVEIDETYRAGHCEAVIGEYVLLAVSDNGVGIDKDAMEKLFDPFFTTKELGKGTGLGLAMIYGIVKQNNGYIYVYSEPGQGTTFKIYLPRYRGDAAAVAKSEQRAMPGRGHGTILLVEDEPAILKMTETMLCQLGYKVLPAASAGAALVLAEKHGGEIDLLLSDVVMPEMNGRDLAKVLSTMLPGLKCVFTSGYTENVIAHHGVLDAGMHFIQKPFTLEGLAAMIKDVLADESV